MARRAMMAVLALSVLLGGCWATPPYDPNVLGGQYYLCCNMTFNQDRDASDANYMYSEGAVTLPYGTRLVVTRVAAERIAFLPLGETETFYLDYRFGSQPAKQYFDRILLTTDPREAAKGLDAPLREAIAQGHLEVGMSKEQVLLARGYPPGHRTPDIESDE